MKKRVEELVSGTFEYKAPKLILSETAVSLQLHEGEAYRGEFFFAAEDNSRIKGMLTASNRRILLSEDRFSGDTIHIAYGIDTNGLKAGIEEKAEIMILSNLGEYRIKVRFVIQKGQVKSSLGEIHNLDDFAVLAKADYREAFRIFTSEKFPDFLGEDKRTYIGLYKGMAHNPVTYQNMEEFLIGAGKKEPVEITLDKERKEAFRLGGSMKDSVYIYRSTWGYTRMEVEVEGDFLEVDKKIITSEDFIGSVYGLEYIILRDKLGSGRHRGRIRIKSVYKVLTFEILASAERDYQISMHAFESRMKRDLALGYLNLRAGVWDYRTWKEKAVGCLQELKNAGDYDAMMQLYEAGIYLEDDDIGRARAALKVLEDRKFTAEETQEEGMHLYLMKKTGLLPDALSNISERIRSLYRRNPESLVLLTILLHEDEEIKNSPVKQLHLMEQQYEMGSRSPFLYLEAYEIIKKDESQFKKLSLFMIQVLAFAGKQKLLTKELGMRIAYLARHEKEFRSSVYRLLCDAYEVYPGKDALEAVCKLIMLGQPGRKEYFKWYALAVEQDIRITRLYEFYIETMSRNYQEMLPKSVRLYFSYNNTLSNSRKAFIYAKVIHNKEQDPDTYRLYRDAMQTFAVQSLLDGKNNEDYAVLYQEFITEIRDDKQGDAAARVIFTHRLYSDDPKVRNVIVCHSALKQEETYSCIDGVAYINLYSKDSQIIFEDAKRRRYLTTVDYNLQKLLDGKELAYQCMTMNIAHPGLLLYVCGDEPLNSRITVKNLGCFQLAADSDAFEDSYRCMVRRRLLEYYDQNAGDDTLNEYLGRLDYQEFYKVDYLLLQDVLIRHGFYQEAFELILQYGYEGIETASLFKLCRRMILDMEFTEHEELIYLSHYVAEQGKYDEVVLGYLRDNYIGPAQEMILLWEKLCGFQMDSYTLEEEILLIAMYTRTNLPKLSKVLERYIRSHGKEIVIAAVFTFLSYGYFLQDLRIDMFVFKGLESVYERGWELDIICELALLKRYRFCKKLTGYQQKNVRSIMKHCGELGLRFAFFKELPPELIRGYQLEDKIFVEEQVAPNAQVTLYYALQHANGEEPVFHSEPMKSRFHGIFSREFLLFYGERLTYYLTIEEGQNLRQTEPVTVMPEAPATDGATKYERINQMLADRKLGKDKDLVRVMEDYLWMEQKTSQLFMIIE